MPYSRTVAEVLNAHGDTIKDEIRKVLPATVTAVNPALQTVDVIVGVQNPLFDEYGNVSYEVLPALSNVPLACLRGGGFFVWLPVIPGDTVLLVFSDLSLDTWRVGTGATAVEPGWAGKHTADSPIAIPIIVPDAKVSLGPSADPTKLIVGKDGSAAQIKVSATDIELGALATDAVALASKVDAIFTAIATATPVAGDGGAAIIAAVADALAALTPPGSTASLLVKSG